jgi:hypothetical protein
MAAAAALAATLSFVIPGVAGADPSTPAPAPPAGPKTSITADGTFSVGTDIAPGVYSSAGPVGDGTCFWKRTGADGSTIDNALTKKPQTVEIDATDKSFKTNGCQAWQLTDDAVPPPGVAPALAGLQLGAMMAQLNARAAASGQNTQPPAAPAAPAPAPLGPAPGPEPSP